MPDATPFGPPNDEEKVRIAINCCQWFFLRDDLSPNKCEQYRSCSPRVKINQPTHRGECALSRHVIAFNFSMEMLTRRMDKFVSYSLRIHFGQWYYTSRSTKARSKMNFMQTMQMKDVRLHPASIPHGKSYKNNNCKFYAKSMATAKVMHTHLAIWQRR